MWANKNIFLMLFSWTFFLCGVTFWASLRCGKAYGTSKLLLRLNFFTICSLSALARPLPSACFWFPSAVKNLMDLQCLYWKGLYPVHALVSTKSFYRRVHIQKAFLQCGKAYESSRRWFWFNICHKFFNVCAIRALTQQMLS